MKRSFLETLRESCLYCSSIIPVERDPIDIHTKNIPLG